MNLTNLRKAIQHNCDISDARDNGIYSICMLVLKLRNLYKWENNLDPWVEPEPAVLLDWIDAKEQYWEEINGRSYVDLPTHGGLSQPFDLESVNSSLKDTTLMYGAGYGRSMKSIFFLAEIITKKEVDGCPVVILGKEHVRELASPFAMLQDGQIIIKRESLRFFFWDQMQEIRSSCKASLHHALKSFHLITDGKLDNKKFKAGLDAVVDHEIPFFIYHEIGEMRETTLDSESVKKIIRLFPNSVIEFVVRSLKDILADTHPQGMLKFIIAEKRDSSLGFYVGFLDGLRRLLFPEMVEAFTEFLKDNDWRHFEKARAISRAKNIALAEKLMELCADIDNTSEETIKEHLNKNILLPLGLDPQN